MLSTIKLRRIDKEPSTTEGSVTNVIDISNFVSNIFAFVFLRFVASVRFLAEL